MFDNFVFGLNILFYADFQSLNKFYHCARWFLKNKLFLLIFFADYNIISFYVHLWVLCKPLGLQKVPLVRCKGDRMLPAHGKVNWTTIPTSRSDIASRSYILAKVRWWYLSDIDNLLFFLGGNTVFWWREIHRGQTHIAIYYTLNKIKNTEHLLLFL